MNIGSIILGLFLVFWLILGIFYYLYLKPFFIKRKQYRWLQNRTDAKEIRMNQIIFDSLYQDIDATSISKIDRKNMNNDSPELVYGEIEFPSFFNMLEKVNPKPGDVFYDLGCGAGKAVIVAALCFEFAKICGVEILPGLYKTAIERLDHLKHIMTSYDEQTQKKYAQKISRISFQHNNFLNYDFSDADIIYITATCFHPDRWDAIINKLLETKKGTRIITTTKKIHHPGFQLLYQQQFLMSWGMNTVNAYVRVIA